MLFIYHTSAIFTDFGDFYIKTEKSNIFSNIFILLTFSWYMPLLFFLAGASTYFALKRRSEFEYIKERTKKLLLPFIFGIIVILFNPLVPVYLHDKGAWGMIDIIAIILFIIQIVRNK